MEETLKSLRKAHIWLMLVSLTLILISLNLDPGVIKMGRELENMNRYFSNCSLITMKQVDSAFYFRNALWDRGAKHDVNIQHVGFPSCPTDFNNEKISKLVLFPIKYYVLGSAPWKKVLSQIQEQIPNISQIRVVNISVLTVNNQRSFNTDTGTVDNYRPLAIGSALEMEVIHTGGTSRFTFDASAEDFHRVVDSDTYAELNRGPSLALWPELYTHNPDLTFSQAVQLYASQSLSVNTAYMTFSFSLLSKILPAFYILIFLDLILLLGHLERRIAPNSIEMIKDFPWFPLYSGIWTLTLNYATTAILPLLSLTLLYLRFYGLEYLHLAYFFVLAVLSHACIMKIHSVRTELHSAK